MNLSSEQLKWIHDAIEKILNEKFDNIGIDKKISLIHKEGGLIGVLRIICRERINRERIDNGYDELIIILRHRIISEYYILVDVDFKMGFIDESEIVEYMVERFLFGIERLLERDMICDGINDDSMKREEIDDGKDKLSIQGHGDVNGNIIKNNGNFNGKNIDKKGGVF